MKVDPDPFPHVIIDSFLDDKTALAIAREFPDYDDKEWLVYDTPAQVTKDICGWGWRNFKPETYKIFNRLCADDWCAALSKLFDKRIYPDCGLYAAGLHIHGNGGILRPHLDASIHPKLALQRKLNLIYYVTPDYQEDWGGHLGLYGKGTTKEPGPLVKEIAPRFNRALIFDTSQQSWHGITRKLNYPEGKYRQSITVYYFCYPEPGLERRASAFFP